MTNGIKEKDIRDMQKCFDKIETILERLTLRTRTTFLWPI